MNHFLMELQHMCCAADNYCSGCGVSRMVTIKVTVTEMVTGFE
jgi:hypothetical protein